MDEHYMRLALEQARLAWEKGEVPVGAVIVRGDEVLAMAHNCPIAVRDPSAHAEIMAIRQAALEVGNYRLAGSTLYVTLEPCIMCAGAIVHARIARLVYGAEDPKGGAVVSRHRLLEEGFLNHHVEITEGILKEKCSEIMSRFFREKRIVSRPISG